MIVGLTGGIGSGKTTVAKFFLELGIPVYFADDEAKKLMINSEVIKKKINDAFGDESYKNGKLNRSFLADKIFNDKVNLQIINKIVHPEVTKDFLDWIDEQTAPYVIQENAIIFESKSQSHFDYIITVTAPKELRIQRAMIRDEVTEEEVLSRMNNQMPEMEKVKLCDSVIYNIDLKDTKRQVKRLHKRLLSIATKKLKS